MAYGYERGFVLEHDETLRRRINCKDCINYNKDDKSCMKRPLYLPEDGYNFWKGCKFFALESRASHYDLKAAEYERVIHQVRKNEKEKQKQSVKNQSLHSLGAKNDTSASTTVKDASKKQSSGSNTKPELKSSSVSDTLSSRHIKYTVFRYYGCEPPKGLTYKYYPYTEANGSKNTMMVGLDTKDGFAYIDNNIYTSASIDQVVHRFLS